MKSLINIISEKLKIGSNTEIDSKFKNELLDKNIDSLKQLNDILEEYLELSKFNDVFASGIKSKRDSWKTPITNINVFNHFSIIFFKDENDESEKYVLRCADYYGSIIMQLVIYDKRNVAKHSKIYGGSMNNLLKPGKNLLEFIKKMLKDIEENESEYPDNYFLEIFKDIK